MDAINTSKARAGGRAPVNGLSMYYNFADSGQPVVYIRPLIPFGGVRGNALPAYIQTHRRLSMDLQGHGRTPDVDRPLSFEQEADDVAALISHEGRREPNEIMHRCPTKWAMYLLSLKDLVEKGGGRLMLKGARIAKDLV
jgi:hypothetical protein